MVRILCLHGFGTSSQIFESQLLPLRMSLPDLYELIFADGEVECERARGRTSYSARWCCTNTYYERMATPSGSLTEMQTFPR
jgi:hypothetical protein